MSEKMPVEQELISEGFKYYLDAKYAMSEFERKIQSGAKNIMSTHLLDIQNALGVVDKVFEEQISSLLDANLELGGVTIGAYYGWDNGIRLGIGWRDAGDHIQPMACCAFTSSAYARRDYALRALRTQSDNHRYENIQIAASPSTSLYQATVWSVVGSGVQIVDLRSRMNEVFSAAIHWSKLAGGMQKVMYP